MFGQIFSYDNVNGQVGDITNVTGNISLEKGEVFLTSLKNYKKIKIENIPDEDFQYVNTIIKYNLNSLVNIDIRKYVDAEGDQHFYYFNSDLKFKVKE